MSAPMQWELHDWIVRQPDGWSVCQRCGLVRNYTFGSECKGRLPSVAPRDALSEIDAAADELDPGHLLLVSEEQRALIKKISEENAREHIRQMALVGELHEHLALMVRYLKEQADEGDGIADEHFDGFQAARSLVERVEKIQGSIENAQLEMACLVERASNTPGMSAELDALRDALSDCVKALEATEVATFPYSDKGNHAHALVDAAKAKAKAVTS